MNILRENKKVEKCVPDLILFFVQISVLSLFLGRAIQHFLGATPYREFFWDQELLESSVNFFLGVSWKDYVTDIEFDFLIQGLTKMIGILYLLMAISIFFIHKKIHKKGYILKYGTFLLFIYGFLKFKTKFYEWGQFFEYTIQIFSPLLLFFIAKKYFINKKKVILGVKLMISLTFLGHGLYAFGFYSVPGNFIDMILKVFGGQESTARLFLKIAGCWDFVIAIFVLFYNHKWKNFSAVLYFAAIWGGATSLARVLAHFDLADIQSFLNQWPAETLVRIPHALLPLVLILLVKDNEAKIKNNYIESYA